VSFSSTRVLVTGGAGFIGSHLVERLLHRGYRVRILDNFSTGHRENIAPWLEDVEVVEGDIQSYERVHTAVQGCEVVFHEAALPSVPRSIQDPLTSNAANVIGTLNLALVARDSGVQRAIFASSSSVYGANEALPKHEGLQPCPISPYAVAKLAAEGYCQSFFHVYGLETVALRYFNVFGPRQDPLSQYAAVIPNFITAMHAGCSPRVYGDGEQSRDFTYVDNVVEANMRAMEAPDVGGKAFNVACGQQITLNHLLAELRDLTGSRLAAEYLPARPGDVLHSLADISRAEHELGYLPTIDFREGLRRTLEFYGGAAMPFETPALAA
jgi:UDP-glucose 4-epimerase